MGKLGPVQEQTMEEILASIRRMISEGDPRIGEPHSLEPRLVEAKEGHCQWCIDEAMRRRFGVVDLREDEVTPTQKQMAKP